MSSTTLPLGFRAYVTNVGIKDSTDDFTIVAADQPSPAAAVFTQSSFAGPSVVVSRSHVANGIAQAVVIISKNANVATGPVGLANAREVVDGVAAAIGATADNVLIASTGVIGRQYPMDNVRAGLAAIPSPLPFTDADRVGRGMMTTDTVIKIASAEAGAARVVGVAKGVGMIEPNMATMISVMFTDADVTSLELDTMFRRVVGTTLNCVSIDTDTSTSDTAIVLASGAAGRVDLDVLESAMHSVAMSLTKQIARDGEGATKLIEVHVDGAADHDQARRVAKSIVNSPLVKTAVHGADPNWGRVAMAIGKATSANEIDPDDVVIRFGDADDALVVYPGALTPIELDALSSYMAGDTVRIHVSLNRGPATATVWGCDLSDGYVRINADYTT